MTRMLKVVETYRADSEDEVNDLIENAKADSSFDLAKYSSEYKEKKSKGDVVERLGDLAYKSLLSNVGGIIFERL